MGSKLSEIPKTYSNNTVTNDSGEDLIQFNTEDILSEEMQVGSIAEQDYEKNYCADTDVILNFIDDIQMQEPKVKKAFAGKFKAITLFVFLVVVFVCIIMGVLHINNTVVVDEVFANAEPVEKATEKIVPVTNEKLKFKKDSYSVVAGKTVKLEYTYTPPGKDKQYDEPEIIYTSANIEVATVDKNGKVTGVVTGTTNIVALTSTGIYTTVPITVIAPKKHIIEDVPIILQGDEYPSGCESVSATMLLKYYGFEMEVDRFIDDYLPKSDFHFDKNGEMYGPDVYSAFIGSPYSKSALGCFPPVIENAINDYFLDKGFRAVDITGSSVESLISNYIAKDEPVLIWATMWMAEPVVTYEWKVEGAAENSPYKDGDTCQWLANEHCMLLVGYDEDYYYLNDPLIGKNTKYEKEIFDKRYAQMGKCALAIDKTK